MFRTVPLSITRSFSLYTQQWYMSYRILTEALQLCNNNCIIYCVPSVHNNMLLCTDGVQYIIQLLLHNGMVSVKFIASQARSIHQYKNLKFNVLKCCADIFFNRQFLIMQVCWQTSLLCVQWKTPDDGQRNCQKHIEFHPKNKFEKLVHLVGFIIKINAWKTYHTNRM